MSPILVRPVREQLEHDRVIRLLQAKYKRKFDVAINPGNEQAVGVGPGPSQWYPDLVLQTSDRVHRLAGVVEVETTESVNNLEAMSQWATFGRLRVPFHLYLPTGSVDSARRFCAELGIPVAELWAYQAVGDQLRFTLVQRSAQASESAGRTTVDAPPDSKPAAKAAPPKAAAARSRPPAAERPTRAAAAPRRRPNGQTSRTPTPARQPAARAAVRRPAAKAAKSAAPRRTVAKAPARKAAKPASRAQKRR